MYVKKKLYLLLLLLSEFDGNKLYTILGLWIHILIFFQKDKLNQH